MSRVNALWRYPVKSHGREPLERVTLTAGATIPWDRTWAVAHDRSGADGSEWVPCAHFSRGAKAPALMAITAELDPGARRLVLRHPDLPDLVFWPDEDPQALLDWSRPLIPDDRATSARVLPCPGRGYTDSDFPSVTLCNLASHRAVEGRLGRSISTARWRGNIWVDGLAPWEEFDWIDREIRVGDAIVIPRERTERCKATTANPDTGRRDTDTLGVLESWGHRDFGVRAEVVRSGQITLGAGVEPL